MFTGIADLSTTSYHAFHSAGPSPISVSQNDLGTFGGPNSSANSLTDAGHIVGGADTSQGGTDAYLFDTVRGLQDLNGLITPNSGWILIEEQGISRSGQIVGF